MDISKAEVLQILNFRRDLHQRAETAFNEWQTFDYILNVLKDVKGEFSFLNENDLKAFFNKVPLSCRYQSKKNTQSPIPAFKLTFKLGIGKHIAIRCDMDGLPIKESEDPEHLPYKLGFRSQKNMHACAHDGHMSISLAVILWINANLDKLQNQGLGALSFIFQCGEEGCKGAQIITASTWLLDIDEIYGYHLGMGLPSGYIATHVDNFLATLKFKLDFYGRKAHAGKFYEGLNALSPLCYVIDNALKLINKDRQLLVNFSNVEVPGSSNIIPDRASCVGEIRAKNIEDLEFLEQELQTVIQKSGVEIVTQAPLGDIQKVCLVKTISGKGIPIKNSLNTLEQLNKALKISKIRDYGQTFSFKASEDCSLLIDKVQNLGGSGAYFVIGSDIKAPHHHSAFDFDEDSLILGFKFLKALILSYIQP